MLREEETACLGVEAASGGGENLPGAGEISGALGGRQGWEGRGRRGSYEERPQLPEIDPALLERRRASNAALLKRQVSQAAGQALL